MALPIEIELLIKEAIANGYYGSIELKFENGRLVLIRKSETLKPASYKNSLETEGAREINSGTYQRR